LSDYRPLPPTAEPWLLSILDAATALRVHPNTIRNLVRAGTLPAVRIGARRLIDANDLRAFIESSKGATP
jgi:excisionase family DNA binding protein